MVSEPFKIADVLRLDGTARPISAKDIAKIV